VVRTILRLIGPTDDRIKVHGEDITDLEKATVPSSPAAGSARATRRTARATGRLPSQIAGFRALGVAGCSRTTAPRTGVMTIR